MSWSIIQSGVMFFVHAVITKMRFVSFGLLSVTYVCDRFAAKNQTCPRTIGGQSLGASYINIYTHLSCTTFKLCKL